MKKMVSRAATFLALLAALGYSLHQPHIESLQGDGGAHHCCVCHTVGMTAPAGAPVLSPTYRHADDVQLLSLAAVETGRLGTDSPRGPPAV